jgi:hypothetical protein
MKNQVNQRKKPDCSIYPDEIPTTDITGRRSGKLVMLYPVYVRRQSSSGRKWFWLAECDCGKEVILCNVTQSESCGCGHIEGVKKMVEKRRDKSYGQPKENRTTAHRMKKPKPFDRGVCVKKSITCDYYRECCDERLEGKPVSSRYVDGGGCYTDAKSPWRAR